MEPMPVQEEGFERIVVRCGDHAEAFRGRWLVAPDPELTRATLTDFEGGYDWEEGAFWAVALTEPGAIAVYRAHREERWPGSLIVYATLKDAGNFIDPGAPRSVLAFAEAKLTGTFPVIERDI